jgi:hypothetical protein
MSAEQGLFRRAMVPIAVVGCLAVAYHEGQPGLIVHHDGFNFSVRSPGKPAERDAYSVAVHRQRSETQTATSQDAAASKNDVVIHGIALGWSATTEYGCGYSYQHERAPDIRSADYVHTVCRKIVQP